jgi:prepilin-type processing-associated H-X9-DG protein
MRKPPVVVKTRTGRILDAFVILIVLAVLAAILWPVQPHRRRAIVTECLSKLKQSGVAILIYQEDNDELFPLRDSWMDTTFEYRKRDEVLHCPLLQVESKNKDIYGYCFNAELSAAKTPANPREKEMLFESVNLARNASGSLASLPSPGRHKGKNNVVFADCHAKARVTP